RVGTVRRRRQPCGRQALQAHPVVLTAHTTDLLAGMVSVWRAVSGAKFYRLIARMRRANAMQNPDRPRFRIDANRQSGSRKVRYVETSRPDDGSCTLCRLDEENPAPLESRTMSEPQDDE